jgi:hypothetical protein
MTFKEIAPAFVWAGLVVGVTAAVIAAVWYQNAIQDVYYAALEFVNAANR